MAQSEHNKLVEEFRSLRRAGVSRPLDLKSAPTLLWHSGRGNIDVATQFMIGALHSDDLHIQAALASLGFVGYGNVEERMNDFAATVHRDSTRTVRRWTDEGFEKLASLVLEWSEEEGNHLALLQAFVFRDSSAQLMMVLSGTAPPGAGMRFPEITLNGDGLPLEPWTNALRSGEESSAPDPRATVLPEPNEEPLYLLIGWPGSVNVRYEVQLHPNVSGYAVGITLTERWCELVLSSAPNYFGAGWSGAADLRSAAQA